MTIEEDMLRWLHDNGTPEAVRVTRYEEYYDHIVGCGEGTCEFEITAVYMYYLDSQGREDYDVYEGELGTFIRELTNIQP